MLRYNVRDDNTVVIIRDGDRVAEYSDENLKSNKGLLDQEFRKKVTQRIKEYIEEQSEKELNHSEIGQLRSFIGMFTSKMKKDEEKVPT